MASGHPPDLNQLRRRLRGLPHPSLLQELQQQLDTFDVAAVVADNTGRYVAANARATQMTGYSRAELCGLHVRDLMPPIQGELGTPWSRFIQSGSQSGEFVLHRKDGTSLRIRYAAYASVAPGLHLSLLTAVGGALPG